MRKTAGIPCRVGGWVFRYTIPHGFFSASFLVMLKRRGSSTGPRLIQDHMEDEVFSRQPVSDNHISSRIRKLLVPWSNANPAVHSCAMPDG
jgi:hypothetical protein